ncbi:hypothetical protein AB0I69_42670 [Streptomyces sp. NPDC050508]|uniref:hypothetical protein n=1 Tax=Streptomyces sp. NPDC050508 TaxID=3155405 RepID=UPI00342F54FD
MTTSTPFILHIDGQRTPGRDRADLEAENERLRAEIARLRAGEEPAETHQPPTTGGHVLWMLNNSTPETRVALAKSLLSAAKSGNACFEANHANHLRFYSERSSRLEATVRAGAEEARRLSEVSDGAGRGVALTIGFVLTQGDSVGVV